MYRLLIVIVTAALCLFILSCDKRNPLLPEALELTSLSFSEAKIMLDAEEFTYRQAIEVQTAKSLGLLYAFKLTTLKAEPLPGITTDPEGWLLMSDASIWTASNQFSLDFTSQNGRIQDLITSVQVKVKHPDGTVEDLESPFRSTRVVDSVIEVPFNNYANVAAGIEFKLRESIGDIYVDGMYAHHFMYRLNIIDSSLQILQAGDWYSTMDNPDIRKAILNQNSTPALTFNAPNTYTQFECYVVSRSGVVQAVPTSVHFNVVSGYQPVAMIYSNTFLGLGQYHYAIANESPAYDLNPIPPNGDKHNREFWSGNNGLEGINSPDFKLHLRWGYKGQYGTITSNGTLIYTDNPFDRELNTVLSPTGVNYFSRITAFWLRLDGAAFPNQPQFFNAQVVNDLDGLSWLRVPNFNDNSRHCILQGLGSGQHSVELKVEDLQGTLSPLAATQTFNLVPYKSPSERDGILLIDNSPAHTSNSPEALVDGFYDAVVPTTWGAITSIDLGTQSSDRVSPVALQNYKAILWHSDNPSSIPNLMVNLDALDIYLGNQGNMVLSGTSRVGYIFSDLENSAIGHGFLQNRLGIGSVDEYGVLSNSLATSPFFVGAIGQPGYNDIPLNLSEPFNSIVNLRQGLSTITWFNASAGTAPIYALGCKPVTATAYPPTQEQYDLYSSKYVAYKHSHAGSNVVVFGFPLSYMEPAPTASALSTVFNEILGNSSAQRRNK